MKARDARWWFAAFLVITSLLNVDAQAGQKDFQRLTVGYTPISGASIPSHCGRRKNLSKIWFRGFPGLYGGLAAY